MSSHSQFSSSLKYGKRQYLLSILCFTILFIWYKALCLRCFPTFLKGRVVLTSGKYVSNSTHNESSNYILANCVYNIKGKLSLILRRSRTGTVWFYTSTSNKRAARPKLYTKSLTRDLKRMYSRFTLVRISINL